MSASEAAIAEPEAVTTTSDKSEIVKKDEKVKRQSSVANSNDPERFKHGVLVRGKFIGVEDVKKETGDEVCQTSMIKLKAVVQAKKEHKQRICVKVDLDGIEIQDEKTNQTIFKHSVNRISYIARDIDDARAIGYIYKNSANNFQYFAIKTEKQAQELFNLLKDLFEVVLEMRNKKKDEDGGAKQTETETKKDQPEQAAQAQAQTQAQTQAPKLETLTSVESNDQLISGLEEKIKQMNEQPSLLDIPSGQTFEDSSFEKSSELLDSTSSKPKETSTELLGLFDPPPTNPNDKFNNLVNQINQLTTGPQRLPPMPPAGVMGAGMASPNPFQQGGMMQGPPFYQQPNPAYNPFGAAYAPQYQMQRPPVPQPSPFGVPQPNPFPNQNQKPW